MKREIRVILTDGKDVVVIPQVGDLPDFSTGTCLQEAVSISFQALVDLFGEPNVEPDGYKTDAEWLVLTPAGSVTIYNWKDGINYLGRDGVPVEEITNWHVGARSPQASEFVRALIGKSELPVSVGAEVASGNLKTDII